MDQKSGVNIPLRKRATEHIKNISNNNMFVLTWEAWNCLCTPL